MLCRMKSSAIRGNRFVAPWSEINMERVMENREFLMTLAEIEVAFRFHFNGTEMLFRSYEHKEVPDKYTGEFLTADLQEIQIYAAEKNVSQEFAEYWRLMEKAADFLTIHGCTMFHGVAIIFGNGAYILTAPSGTGKSTQYRNLKTLYGERINIINGDKPILGVGSKGFIMVYPSPWNGKEGWGGDIPAPLRGVFLLEQGKSNILESMDMKDAAIPVIQQFIYTAPSRQSVHTVFRMADTMLGSVPIYKFSNRGDLVSSSMLFEQIIKIEEQWR